MLVLVPVLQSRDRDRYRERARARHKAPTNSKQPAAGVSKLAQQWPKTKQNKKQLSTLQWAMHDCQIPDWTGSYEITHLRANYY